MNVKEVMTAHPEPINATESVRTALGKMLELDVRHLPVLQDGELIGMLSDRDVRLYSTPLDEAYTLDDVHAKLDTPVAELMTGDVMAADEETEVSEIARMMIDQRVGAVPILQASTNKLIGIVSYVDILKAVEEQL